MKIKKNKEKSKSVDAIREFYANIDEIRDLYQNQGYLKAKSLYEEMANRHQWQMSYMSFTVYFNKEIKNKQTKPKEQKNDQVDTPTVTNKKVEAKKDAKSKSYLDDDDEGFRRFKEAEEAFKISQKINNYSKDKL